MRDKNQAQRGCGRGNRIRDLPRGPVQEQSQDIFESVLASSLVGIDSKLVSVNGPVSRA